MVSLASILLMAMHRKRDRLQYTILLHRNDSLFLFSLQEQRGVYHVRTWVRFIPSSKGSGNSQYSPQAHSTLEARTV